MQETEKHVMNEKDLQLLKELRLMDDDFFLKLWMERSWLWCKTSQIPQQYD